MNKYSLQYALSNDICRYTFDIFQCMKTTISINEIFLKVHYFLFFTLLCVAKVENKSYNCPPLKPV